MRNRWDFHPRYEKLSLAQFVLLCCPISDFDRTALPAAQIL
jgi:hypothetical protein